MTAHLPLPARAARFLCSFVRDPLAHWPFVPLSRRLTGNPAGAKQNLYGGAQFLYYRLFGRREGGAPLDTEVRAAARTLRRTGVLLMAEPVVPPDLTSRIQQKFDRLAHTSHRAQESAYIVSFQGDEIVADVPDAFEVFRIQRSAT